MYCISIFGYISSSAGYIKKYEVFWAVLYIHSESTFKVTLDG